MNLTSFKDSDYCSKLESYFKSHQPKNMAELATITRLSDELLKSVDFRVVTLNYDGNNQSFYVLSKCSLPCNNAVAREAVRQQIYGYLQDEKSKAITPEDKHLIHMFSFFMDLGIRTNECDLTKSLTDIEKEMFKAQTDLSGKIDAKISIESRENNRDKI